MTRKTGNPLGRPWAVADASDANSLFEANRPRAVASRAGRFLTGLLERA
jgi:hypothetical protein